jgi:hypothetical protein
MTDMVLLINRGEWGTDNGTTSALILPEQVLDEAPAFSSIAAGLVEEGRPALGRQDERLSSEYQILGRLPRDGHRSLLFLVDCVGVVRPGVFLIPHRISEDRMLLEDLIQGLKKLCFGSIGNNFAPGNHAL